VTEQTVMITGAALVFLAGLIFYPRTTMGLVGAFLHGAVEALKDFVGLLLIWM
jgi:hypothetical protein